MTLKKSGEKNETIFRYQANRKITIFLLKRCNLDAFLTNKREKIAAGTIIIYDTIRTKRRQREKATI